MTGVSRSRVTASRAAFRSVASSWSVEEMNTRTRRSGVSGAAGSAGMPAE